MPNPFLDNTPPSVGKNPFLDTPVDSGKKSISQIDASIPTTPSMLTGDASLMQHLGADDDRHIVDDLLPLKKNIATGKVSAAIPETLRSMFRGTGNLISEAQRKGTDTSPDAINAMMGMGGAFKPTGNALAKTVEAVGGKARGIINSASDSMATKVPIDKENGEILKILQKAGHSPEEIVNIVNRAKEHGMTVGEASGNPKILGIERKISGLSQPGGETIRDFVKNRVDPNNNVSMPYKLKSIADPLVEKVTAASKQIGAITESAPKTPIQMTSLEQSLAREGRPPKSTVTNTLNRIDGLIDWAKSQGGTFADWHRVKQEIWSLGNEAKDPSAVEKLDSKTVTKYYKKINEMLSGKSPGLPKDLQDTAQKYRAANDTFSKNLSGRTIQGVLDKMPTGGTPASTLKYLYKNLAGSKELQEELFSGMPESNRSGMMKFLEAIKDSGRSGVSDVVKSMEDGTPSFPTSWNATLGKLKNIIIDAIFRKDYDALGKALTSPDAEIIAKKLGYIKPQSPAKPILRLTYQPKPAEIAVNRGGEARLLSRSEQAEINQARERLENLGLRTDYYKLQDIKTVRELEKKYGQSELGKFVIANRYTPFIDKAWEIPKTEYSQATVNRMMADSAWNKLDEEQQHKISMEIEKAWDTHKITLADMILSAREAATELAAAKGEPAKIGNVGEALMKSTGTPIENVIPKIHP